MLSKNFINAINVVSEKLNGQKIKWAVIGSANMTAQGMNVEPKDLDIIVRVDDLNKVKDIFSAYEFSGIEEMKIKSGKPTWKTGLEINGVKVEFSGQNDDGEYVNPLVAEKIKNIDIEGVKVLCLDLEEEAKAYEQTGRENKATLIREFIRKNK